LSSGVCGTDDVSADVSPVAGGPPAVGGGAFVATEGATPLGAELAFGVPSSGCKELVDGAEPPAAVWFIVVCEGLAAGAGAFVAETGCASLDDRGQKGKRPIIMLVTKATISTAQTITVIRAATDRAGGSLSP
jgi:hypothetical protein